MSVHPFFHASYYLASHVDLVVAGLHSPEQLWQHYVDYGAHEQRKPNAWFDADYYLQHNPDLVAAGLTGHQALQHFYSYGLYESSRLNTFSRSIKQQDFTASDYAAEPSNADLLSAFAIDDPTQLSALQTAQLFGHYLAWGFAEGRLGAGPIAEQVKKVNVLPFASEGTVFDDEIHWSYAHMGLWNAGLINGLGGWDTLVLGPGVITHTHENALQVTHIEQITIEGSVEQEFHQLGAFIYSHTPVQRINLQPAAGQQGTDFPVQLRVDAQAVAQAHDSLVLDITNPGQHQGISFSTHGYEQLTVNLGEKVQKIAALQVDHTQGDTFSVQFAGGNAAGVDVALINNQGSAAVQHLMIDFSALEGLLRVEQWGELQHVRSVQVQGSQAVANDFAGLGLTLTAQHDLTLVGGSANDIFTATLAIDSFTGKAGQDVFDFTVPATAAVRVSSQAGQTQISAIDTITDFKKGDGLRVEQLQLLTLKTGEEAALSTLEDWVGMARHQGDAFNYNGDAYVVLRPAQSADLDQLELVKLAGVNVMRFFDAQDNAAWDESLQAFTWVT